MCSVGQTHTYFCMGVRNNHRSAVERAWTTLAPIWLQGISQRSQTAQLDGPLRQYIPEVIIGKKGM